MSLAAQIAAHKASSLKDQIAAHRASAATPQAEAPPPSVLTKTGRAGRAERSAAIPGTGESRLATMAKDFGQGVYTSAAELSMGLQDLVGLPGTEGQRMALKQARQQYEEAGPAAGMGRFAGELAQFALPSKVATTALQTIKGLPQMIRGASPALAEVGTAGLVGAAQAPKEGETRGEGALDEVLAATGGTAVGKVLSKTLGKVTKGIEQTDAAKRLAERGVELTPGQASKGGLAKSTEYIAQVLPMAAKGRKKALEASTLSMNQVLLRETAPEGFKDAITKTGVDGARQLKGAFTDAYEKAWAGATRPGLMDLASIRSIGGRGKRELGEVATTGIDTIMREVSELGSKYTPKRLHVVDKMLRKSIRDAEGGANPNTAYAAVLQDMRDRLRLSVGEETQQALAKVDGKYGEFMSVQKAGGGQGALLEGALIQPDDLARGVTGVGKEARMFTGNAPGFDMAADVRQTMGRKEPAPLINAIKGVMQHVPNLLPMKLGGEVAMGRTGVQRGLQKILPEYGIPIAEALRRFGISPAAIGAAAID